MRRGGLGLFKLNDFLDAQRCSWIKRAQNLDDNWKRKLYASSYGHITNIRAEYFNSYESPVLHCIVTSYEKFLANHTMWNENFKTELIFDNPSLHTNLRTRDRVAAQFFGELFNTYKAEIYNLKMTNIYDQGYVPLEIFIRNTGIQISERKLIGLRGVYDTATIKYAKENGANLDNTEILTFINRFKREVEASGEYFVRKK